MKIEAKFGSSTLFAAAAAAASANGAMAADLPVKAPSLMSPVPTSSWQGFYVGASAGASWLNSTQDDASGAVFGYYGGNGTSQKASALGFIGGLQAGYNFQDRNFVYGIEGDVSWIGSNTAASSATLTNYSGYFSGNKTSKVNGLATLRARFGFDFNGTMPYLTMGVALGQIKNTYTLVAPAYGFTGVTQSKTSWQPGIVLGGGIEHMFTNSRWTMKGEVLWVGFKDTSMATSPAYAGSGNVNFKNDMLIGRIGMNYRF